MSRLGQKINFIAVVFCSCFCLATHQSSSPLHQHAPLWYEYDYVKHHGSPPLDHNYHHAQSSSAQSSSLQQTAAAAAAAVALQSLPVTALLIANHNDNNGQYNSGYHQINNNAPRPAATSIYAPAPLPSPPPQLPFLPASSSAAASIGAKTPLDIMVDVSNRLAFAVLNAHTEPHSVRRRRAQNFAYSPCGLSSVLIALWEGVAETGGGYEIYRVLRLPWDRDVVRLGVRDMHRRLRTYFYADENLLDGLSLSRDNVTIRPEYEAVLRYYGYDLSASKTAADEEMMVNQATSTTTFHVASPSPTMPSATTMATTFDRPMVTDIVARTPAIQATTTSLPITTIRSVTATAVTLPTTTFAKTPMTTTTQRPADEEPSTMAAVDETTVMATTKEQVPITTTTKTTTEQVPITTTPTTTEQVPITTTPTTTEQVPITTTTNEMISETENPPTSTLMVDIPMTTEEPATTTSTMAPTTLTPTTTTTTTPATMTTDPPIISTTPYIPLITRGPTIATTTTAPSTLPATTEYITKFRPPTMPTTRTSREFMTTTTDAGTTIGTTTDAAEEISTTTTEPPQSEFTTTTENETAGSTISDDENTTTTIQNDDEFDTTTIPNDSRLRQARFRSQQTPLVNRMARKLPTPTTTQTPATTSNAKRVKKFLDLPWFDLMFPFHGRQQQQQQQLQHHQRPQYQTYGGAPPAFDFITKLRPQQSLPAQQYSATAHPFTMYKAPAQYAKHDNNNENNQHDYNSDNFLPTSALFEFPHHHHHHHQPQQHHRQQPLSQMPQSLDGYSFSAYADVSEANGNRYAASPAGAAAATVVAEASQSANTLQELPFHIDRRLTVVAPFRILTAALRLGYSSTLQASVLELPLDSADYTMLLLLPDAAFDLNGLMQRMVAAHRPVAPTIREIRAGMRRFWIRATVPLVQLKGSAVLTDDLMKLGVKDIFEPARADFTPMTDETGIYAKHIEQLITLNIQTSTTASSNDGPNNQSGGMDANLFNPIEVNVQQPFVFCIVDSQTDLIIMMGQIVNPLSSRIL